MSTMAANNGSTEPLFAAIVEKHDSKKQTPLNVVSQLDIVIS